MLLTKFLHLRLIKIHYKLGSAQGFLRYLHKSVSYRYINLIYETSEHLSSILSKG